MTQQHTRSRLGKWFHFHFRSDRYWVTDFNTRTETTFTRHPGQVELVPTSVLLIVDVVRSSGPCVAYWRVPGGAIR